MAIDKKHLGRKYGPYRYEVGAERIRDFAITLNGGIPGRVFPGQPTEQPHPWCVDEEAARASPYGALVAPPTFAANFAMQPFAIACADPELGIDLVRLVHGEQEFEYLEPVKAGDVLVTVGEITSIRSKGPLDFVQVTAESRREDGTLVVRSTWMAIIRS
jgi:acyl dehydratase